MGEVDTQDKDGWTALHFAATSGHLGIVEELMNNMHLRAVNAKDQTGMSALHWAASYGHPEIAEALMKPGLTEVHEKNKDGLTALELAVASRHAATTAAI